MHVYVHLYADGAVCTGLHGVVRARTHQNCSLALGAAGTTRKHDHTLPIRVSDEGSDAQDA